VKVPSKTSPRDWVIVLDGSHAGGTATYLGELHPGVRQGVKKLANAVRFTRRGAQKVLAGYPTEVVAGRAYPTQLTRSEHTSAHARKTKAQLDREIADFIAAQEQHPSIRLEQRFGEDARLKALWLKHVSRDLRAIDIDRLHDAVQSAIKIVKAGLRTRRPEASRDALADLRRDLAEIERIRVRR